MSDMLLAKGFVSGVVNFVVLLKNGQPQILLNIANYDSRIISENTEKNKKSAGSGIRTPTKVEI
jgi:hypothetical protein